MKKYGLVDLFCIDTDANEVGIMTDYYDGDGKKRKAIFKTKKKAKELADWLNAWDNNVIVIELKKGYYYSKFSFGKHKVYKFNGKDFEEVEFNF